MKNIWKDPIKLRPGMLTVAPMKPTFTLRWHISEIIAVKTLTKKHLNYLGRKGKPPIDNAVQVMNVRSLASLPFWFTRADVDGWARRRHVHRKHIDPHFQLSLPQNEPNNIIISHPTQPFILWGR